MKYFLAIVALTISGAAVTAKEAANEKQAKEATEYRQAIFQLIMPQIKL